MKLQKHDLRYCQIWHLEFLSLYFFFSRSMCAWFLYVYYKSNSCT